MALQAKPFAVHDWQAAMVTIVRLDNGETTRCMA